MRIIYVKLIACPVFMVFFGRSIHILSADEIERMREVGKLAAETLSRVDEIIAPGITTDDIDRFVHAHTLEIGATPATLGYRGFPKSCCTSVNEVVCHGIPGSRVLADGDIVNVDVTHVYNGFFGDTSVMFYVGEPGADAIRVTEIARQCLTRAIAEVGPGVPIGNIGATIQAFAEPRGCSVVRDYTGHGIGRQFHGAPTIRHVGRKGSGTRMRPGMAFTIEPMINLGSFNVRLQPDKWTVVTCDGQLSAQFEHTLLVTDHGCEILTDRPYPLKHSDKFSDDVASLIEPPRVAAFE